MERFHDRECLWIKYNAESMSGSVFCAYTGYSLVFLFEHLLTRCFDLLNNV